ncbi:hypothetical protein GPU89_33610 [Burkholderia cepacia]|nr:hypothetical protein [Burkholderia cepacia]
MYRNGTAASLLMLLAGAYPPRAYAQAATPPDAASAAQATAAPATSDPASVDATFNFDTSILQQRGLDPQIADYFRAAPRYRPGRSRVVVYVNDIRRGRINTRFDDDGAPCFDRTFLDAVGLVVPDAKYAVDGDAGPDTCYDFARAFPVRTWRSSRGGKKCGSSCRPRRFVRWWPISPAIAGAAMRRCSTTS